MRKNGFFISGCRSIICISIVCLALDARADGIFGNGVGARSMSMGGADTAWASDPLGAMAANPSGLGFLTAPELDFGGVAGFAEGQFNKPGVSSGDLDGRVSALPEGAFAMPLGNWPVTLGVSFNPE